MKLASMAGMQVDPVPEESPAVVFDRDSVEPTSLVPALVEVSDEDGMNSDVMEQEASMGLERFVRFIQSQKRQKDKSSRLSRAVKAYEKQNFMEESNQTVGMRLDKAG